MKINWENYKDVEVKGNKQAKEGIELYLIPDGEYKFIISNAEEGKTKNGDPMVSMKLMCITPPYQDKWVWDRIVFSPKAIKRAKCFFEAIGVDTTTGEMKLTGGYLLGRQVVCKIIHKEYLKDGIVKKYNSVTFLGYKPADSLTQVEEEEEDEVPF